MNKFKTQTKEIKLLFPKIEWHLKDVAPLTFLLGFSEQKTTIINSIGSVQIFEAKDTKNKKRWIGSASAFEETKISLNTIQFPPLFDNLNPFLIEFDPITFVFGSMKRQTDDVTIVDVSGYAAIVKEQTEQNDTNRFWECRKSDDGTTVTLEIPFDLAKDTELGIVMTQVEKESFKKRCH